MIEEERMQSAMKLHDGKLVQLGPMEASIVVVGTNVELKRLASSIQRYSLGSVVNSGRHCYVLTSGIHQR